MKHLIFMILVCVFAFKAGAQIQPKGGITGSGTTGYILKFTGSKSAGNSTISQLSNGATTYAGTLDGEGTGNNNATYTTTTGGLRIGYYGQSGYNTIQEFYTNGTKNSSIYEGTGYFSISNKYRFSIKNFTDNTSKFFVDMSTGYTGIGQGYSSPTSQLDVRGQIVAGNGSGVVTSNTSPFYAVRNNLGAPNYYSGMQYVFEVGGGVWGEGYDYSRNEFQFLTTGSTTSKFIWGTGSSASPSTKMTLDMNGGKLDLGGNLGGYAKLEITAGALQGIYGTSSNSIFLNANEDSGIAVKGGVSTGVALQGVISNSSGTALKLDDSAGAILLFKVSSNGTKAILNAVNLPVYSGTLNAGDFFKYADPDSPSGYSIGIMP